MHRGRGDDAQPSPVRQNQWGFEMRLRSAVVAAALLVAMTGVGANAALVESSTMSISGRVTSPDGTGIPGMCMTVVRNTRDTSDPVAGTATTGSLGYYRVTFKENNGTQMEYAVNADANCGANGWWQEAWAPHNVTLTAAPGRNSVSG